MENKLLLMYSIIGRFCFLGFGSNGRVALMYDADPNDENGGDPLKVRNSVRAMWRLWFYWG